MTISDTDFADLQEAVTSWPHVTVAANGLVLPLPLMREAIGDETRNNLTVAFLPHADAIAPQFLNAHLSDDSWPTYLNAIATVPEVALSPALSKTWAKAPVEETMVRLLYDQFPELQKTFKQQQKHLPQLPALDTYQRQCLVSTVKRTVEPREKCLEKLVGQPPDNSWSCQLTKIEDYLQWRVLGPQPTDPGQEMVLSFGWVETPRARGDFIPQYKKPLCIHVANFLSDGRIQYAATSVDRKQPIDYAAINQTMTITQNCRNDVAWQSRLDSMWESLSLVLPPNNYSFLRRVFANQPRSIRGAAVRQAYFFALSYGRGHEA